MACIDCWKKSRGDTRYDQKWDVICSACEGTGKIVPRQVTVRGGLLGATVDYPTCPHCKGGGMCMRNVEGKWPYGIKPDLVQ